MYKVTLFRLSLMFLFSLLFLGTTLRPTHAQESLPENDLNALIAKAESQGSVRIILELNIGTKFVPEGYLSPEEAKAQRGAILAAQLEVQKNLTENYGFLPHATFKYVPYLAVEASAPMLLYLSTHSLVTNIQEDQLVPADLASSTTVIGTPTVWEAGYTGSGWTVAVLDTGVQWDHPFLGGSGASRVVEEACYSTTGTNIVTLCPNGTDVQETGHAADPTTAECLNGGTYLCTHGTHVAGIVAGEGVTYDGVAPGANILAIQVFSRFNNAGDCTGGIAPCVLTYTSDQMLALQRVYDRRTAFNIAAVNMSLGGGSYAAYCDADARKAYIDTLLSVGIATIIATGNNGYTTSISAPACISTAVAVGATTDGDTVASFSNSNSLVDLLAPGVAIDSSVPPSTYANYQGTSMATPHVAGAWALLKNISPSSTPADILSALTAQGVSVTDTRNGVTKPRIQLDITAAYLKPALTWLGNTSDWNTLGNWSPSETPTAISTVVIPSAPAGGNFPTLSGTGNVYDFTIQNGANMAMTGGTLNVYGDFTVQASGGFNATGGTTVFQGAMTQAISMPDDASNQFYHLQIGDGTTTQKVIPASAVDVNGDFALVTGAWYQPGSHTTYVAGNWTDAENKFVPGTSSVVFDGSGGQTAQVTVSTLTFLQESFSAYDGVGFSTYYPSGPTGWVVENTSGGNYPWFFMGWQRNPNPALNGHVRHYSAPGGNTTTWLFTPAMTLYEGVTYQLQFNYGVFSGSRNVRVGLGTSQSSGGMTTTLRDFTATNTTWNTDNSSFTVPSDGTYYLGFRATATAGTGDGLSLDDIRVTTTPGLLFYNLAVNSGGSGASLGDHAYVKNNLTVNNGGHLALGTNNLMVSGTLTNNGELSQTKNVPGSTTTQFLRILNSAGDATKYYGIDITPVSSMGDTTVLIKGNQTSCTTVPSDALIQRCFEITPTTAVNAALQFWYTEAERNNQAANALKLWHFGSGSNWTQVGDTYTYSEGGTTCLSGTPGGSACWFQVQNVSTYSPFGVGGGASPTALQLEQFKVTSSQPGLSLRLALGGVCGILLIFLLRKTFSKL